MESSTQSPLQLDKGHELLTPPVLKQVSDDGASASPITTIQRAELQARLAWHRAHPDEMGVTFEQMKAQILAAPRLK